MKEEKDFFKKQPVGKLLLKLALPTVTAQIINMPLTMIVTVFAAFAGYGDAPRTSIYMGKGNYEAAEKTLANCFAIQIIISVILTAVLLIWNRDLLLAFGASENTIRYALIHLF